MNRNLNETLSGGKRIFGTPFVGLLGSDIVSQTSSGTDGAGLLANDQLTSNKRYRLLINNPAAFPGVVYENGSFTASSSIVTTYTLYEDNLLVSGTSTVTVNIGTIAITGQPAATTVIAPNTATFTATFNGPATAVQWKRKIGGVGTAVNVVGGTGATTLGSQTLSYTTGATSVSGGNHNTDDTYGFTLTFSGGQVESAYAKLTVNPLIDTIPPTLTGTITVDSISSSSYRITSPIATDNVGVTGYQYKINDGVWVNIPAASNSVIVTGRSPATTDTISMRAFDAAVNYSSALTTTVTLLSTYVQTEILSDGLGLPMVNKTIYYSYLENGRIGQFANKSIINGSAVTNSVGRLVLNSLPAGSGILIMAARDPSDVPGLDKAYYQAVTVV